VRFRANRNSGDQLPPTKAINKKPAFAEAYLNRGLAKLSLK
jgi:hypothetical protein